MSREPQFQRRLVETGGWRVHAIRFRPGQRLIWGDVVPARLCVIASGHMEEKAGGIAYRPSDVVYKPPEARPDLRFGDGGASSITIEIGDARWRDLEDLAIDLRTPFVRPSSTCARLGHRIYAELVEPDELLPLTLEALVLELIVEAFRTTRTRGRARPPRWLSLVRERIREEFRQPFTLEDLARAAGVHRAHLATTFRETYGETVGQAVRRHRVEWAAQELRETEKPLSHIALTAGFSDQSHFTRVFKRIAGVTPGVYRKGFGSHGSARSRLMEPGSPPADG